MHLLNLRLDDEEMPDAEENIDELTAIDQPPKEAATGLQEQATVQAGRRRGRRQVLRKKTIKDDEGYLGKKKPEILRLPSPSAQPSDLWAFSQ